MSSVESRTVRLRPGLEQSRQQHQGKSYLVVKDPVARRYFRFTESQAVILELLTEPANVVTVAAEASVRLGANVPASAIAAFCDSLESKNLLDTPAVRERLGTTGAAGNRDRESILYRRVASFNPERIFDWLLPRTRWAFKPGFQIFGVLLIACGFLINFTHWDKLKASAPDLLNFYTILLVWPIVFSVSAFHEFSHGLTCRHFGGQVHEVGFMLIYFSPAFYCDVSDAWMFPSRKHRMLVTMAGGYAQLILWGLCTILWMITDPATYINQVLLVVVLFSGLQTLFNFNPLIKLDGYYMLSDYLEVPNLRSRALSTLWKWITRSPRRGSFREERAQVVYGVASLVFSTTLLIYVYAAIYTWATSKWATAGLVGFAMFSTVTLRKTALEGMAGLRTLFSYVAVRKYRNGLIGLAALLIALVGRWELKIPAEFKLLAQNDFIVRAETSGTITEVFAREGIRVRKDDLLATTRDFDKQNRVDTMTGELQQQKSVLDRLVAGSLPEEIKRQEDLIAGKNIERANTRKNQEERRRLEANLAAQQAALEQARRELTSQQRLLDEGITAQITRDKAASAVEEQQHQMDATQASIRSLDEIAEREADRLTKEIDALESGLALMKRGSRQEVIRETEAGIRKLETLLASLRQEIRKSEIRAPIDGTVATRFPERRKNERLEVGAEFLRLVDTAGVVAEMMVPEKEIADVKAGNVVWMKVLGLPNESFETHVDSIAPVAQTINGQQMIVVRAQLQNDRNSLKPEMTGVAKIHAGERRIIDLVTRRMLRWASTELWGILP